MQALAIQPTIDNEDRLVSTVSELCEVAEYLAVKSQEDLSHATDVVKMIKTRHKEIDAERTGLVKPLNDTVDKINSRFKTILAPLKTAEDGMKAKMLSFQQEQARIAADARRVAEEQARRAAEKAAKLAAESDRAPIPVMEVALPEPSAASKTSYGSYGGVSTVKRTWAWELLDIAALAAARPDLLQVDAMKVNAEIRGKGGDIPGLRVYEKETIAIR